MAFAKFVTMKEKEDTDEDVPAFTEEGPNELFRSSPKIKALKKLSWVLLAFAVLALAMDYLFDGLAMQLLRGLTASKD